jgi:hypothetical protein
MTSATTASGPQPQKISAWEIVAAVMAILSLMAATIAANNPQVLLARLLGPDECVTAMIVSDPSVRHSIVAVKAGFETNPPVYHLLLREFCRCCGRITETSLRSFSAASAFVALLAVYLALRRAFAAWPAAVAVAALWSNEPLIAQAFQARFYAPLLAATGVFCLVYAARNGGVFTAVLTALLAVLVCTLHYFGIFSLAAIVAGDALASGDPWPRKFRRMVPTFAGPMALLTFIPFVRSQAAGLSVSWIEPFTVLGAWHLLMELFGGATLPAVALAWWISELIRQRGDHAAATADGAGTLLPLAGLSGLLAVPFLIIILSALVQPALASRYAITGLLGLTPLVALVASRLSRRVALVTIIFFALLGFQRMHQFSTREARAQMAQRERIHQLIRADDGLPIVDLNFDAVAYYYAPQLRSRSFVADLRATHRNALSNPIIFSMDMEAKCAPIYPDMPRMADLAALRKLGPFHLNVSQADLPLFLSAKLLPDQAGGQHDIGEFLPFEKIRDSIYQATPDRKAP